LAGIISKTTHAEDELGRKATSYERNDANAWVDSHCHGMWYKPTNLAKTSKELNLCPSNKSSATKSMLQISLIGVANQSVLIEIVRRANKHDKVLEMFIARDGLLQASELPRNFHMWSRWTLTALLHEAGYNTDWIEKCHEQKGVRAAYNKAEYAQQRRDLAPPLPDTAYLLVSADLSSTH
jgi:hypothetical protein